MNVKSDDAFEQVLAANVLVSMSGIVPSYSTYCEVMSTRVIHFQNELSKTGNINKKEIEALIRLICYVTDRLLSEMLRNQGFTWQGDLLSEKFFHCDMATVYTKKDEFIIQNCTRNEIKAYAFRIATLIHFPPEFDSLQSYPLTETVIMQPSPMISSPAETLLSKKPKFIFSTSYFTWATLLLCVLWYISYSFFNTGV